MSIGNNVQKTTNLAESLCTKYNKNIKELSILAVSKKHSATAIEKAVAAGVTQFGESYLQEAIQKMDLLQHLPLTWHFIGPIQSNKTKQIAEHFDWVQSVDRSKVLTRLNDQRPDNLKPINICIQLNYFSEPQKKGVNPDELPQLLDLADKLPNVTLRGIMAIPPKQIDFQMQLSQFEQIADCFRKCQKTYPSLDTLSIGMSNDMEAAIAAGSNMVRIGTALFGERK